MTPYHNTATLMAALGPQSINTVDIWILVERDNAEKLIRALQDFSFGSLGLSPEDFLVEEQFVQLGRKPIRIDLMTGLDGVSFSDCKERVVFVDRDGMDVPFIAREDPLRNKRSSGRSQDLADVEALEGLSP